MTYIYFEIGRMIVKEDKNGEERSEYGKKILEGFSDDLTKRVWERFFDEEFRTNKKVL